MANIIFIDNLDKETKVATFKTKIEALQCAALLDAMLLPDSGMYYAVDYKEKGNNKRSRAGSLRQTVGNITTLYNHLEPIFKH